MLIVMSGRWRRGRLARLPRRVEGLARGDRRGVAEHPLRFVDREIEIEREEFVAGHGHQRRFAFPQTPIQGFAPFREPIGHAARNAAARFRETREARGAADERPFGHQVGSQMLKTSPSIPGISSALRTASTRLSTYVLLRSWSPEPK